MKIKNVMLFAYDFPHKKTQDFIFRLLVEGYNIKYVIAAPWVNLKISPSSTHNVPSHEGLTHPRKICKSFKIPYIRLEHNSSKTINYLKSHPVDLYIIAGARVLSYEVIKSARNKILNLHPGILPQVRGLDTLLWSICYNEPIGISAHLISSRVDLGKLIYKEKLKLNAFDTIIDVSLRLLEKQSDVMIKSIRIIDKSKVDKFRFINLLSVKYNTKMTPSLERKMIKKFNVWLKDQL